MQQYGIDGVLVQRFYGALSDATFLTVGLLFFNLIEYRSRANKWPTDVIGLGPGTSFR
jgi:hypothetical protein